MIHGVGLSCHLGIISVHILRKRLAAQTRPDTTQPLLLQKQRAYRPRKNNLWEDHKREAERACQTASATMFGIDWLSLVLPFSYILVLGGTFVTFSTVYRKRKATQSANLAPWFPPHLQRNIYLSLLHLDPEDGSGKGPKVPESVLRAALLRRAVEDIHRIIQIRTAKTACSSLLARGSVGDDLWQRFSRAEKEMEEELRDVVMEANALAPNWGQTIFQSANEIAANTVLRKRLDEIQAQAESEKAWWDKRRAAIQTDFMKEIDADDDASSVAASDAKATPSSPVVTNASSTKTTSSEDDGVLVDAASRASTPAPPTPSKKKKGRK
ncbi:hypothetical protein RB596_006995 [Gaeumannomyces avenae]